MEWRNRNWLVAKLKQLQLPRHDAETLATWFEAARERGAVLFVGAGWTANARPTPRLPSATESGNAAPLLWSQLADRFRKGLDHDISNAGTLDSLWLAELYRQRYGEDALFTLLREAVPDERLQPGPLHEALRALPWRAILTTNYDTLLTRTFSPHQRVRVCVDDVDLVRSAARGSLELIHLHGVLERPDTIVLALEDYRRYPSKHPGLLAKVRQLFLQHPVLFVGFSVTDPNFLQWAGWLADVAGAGQNPWVSLTPDPPPSLSHGRYWGSRLHFVSVLFPAFRDVVPKLLHVLGEALDERRRSEEVAGLRISAASSTEATIRELTELLGTGEERGAEGPGWDHFRIWLFNAGASHVLDLQGVKWREQPAGSPPKPGLHIVVDARPLAMRERNEELLTTLRTAFGSFWDSWCNLLRPHFRDAWSFERIDLSEHRRPDIWNTSPVPLTPESAPVPIGAATVPPTEDEIDVLRRGQVPTKATPLRTAQDYRMAGYLACQAGHWKSAYTYYKSATEAARREPETLRREWLTLRSQHICLENAILYEVPEEDRELLKQEAIDLRAQINKTRGTLAQLPREESEEPLLEDEIEAERKLASQFVNDLDRRGPDRTVRFGRMYGSADSWLDRVERLWLAPPLIIEAAEAMGTLQWRYGEPSVAARTLARYGFSRLQKFARGVVQSGELDPKELAALVDELLIHGRWPGEWVARAEALTDLLPASSVTQFEAIASFVVKARKALGESSRGIVRGNSVQTHWAAQATVHRLEAASWPLMRASVAAVAVERWLESPSGATGNLRVKRDIWTTFEALPWSQWIRGKIIDRTGFARICVRAIDLQFPGVPTTRSPLDEHLVEAPINFALGMAHNGLLEFQPSAPVRAKDPEELAGRLGPGKRASYDANIAQLDGDARKLAALVSEAVEGMTAGKPPSISLGFELVGVAGLCPAGQFAKLLSFLRAVVDGLPERLATPRALIDHGPIEEGRTVGFVVGRLLSEAPAKAKGRGSTSRQANDRRELAKIAIALLTVLPGPAEFLTACRAPPKRLRESVVGAINSLLRGQGDEKDRFDNAFAGLRGVTRALVQLGPRALADEWLANVAAYVGADDAELARYATWILGEWVVRSRAADGEATASLVVAPALRRAAFDGRAGVRANAARGLVALERTWPGAGGDVLDILRNDPSVAVVHALSEDIAGKW